jgi:hypothetical protein
MFTDIGVRDGSEFPAGFAKGPAEKHASGLSILSIEFD